MCKKDCLTCEYCKYEHKDDYTDIDCNYPAFHDKIPESWKKSCPSVDFEYDHFEGKYNRPVVQIVHDEYYDERIVENCPCWKKRKRKIVPKIPKYLSE
jgi:hypothetical protein